MLSERQFQALAQQVKTLYRQGVVVDRIATLAAADPAWFAATMVQIGGDRHRVETSVKSFPLMSVIKPFLLLYLLEHYGAQQVFEWVGTQPSEMPFNALAQLTLDGGFPRNPMINSGAIALCDRLPGHTGSNRAAALLHWLNAIAGVQLVLDTNTLAAVRAAGSEANRAIARALQAAGRLQTVAAALDTYEQICCCAGSVDDLAQLGLLLASGTAIAPAHRRAVNALMLTCGLYEASAAAAVEIGLPIKSGVSGALLAVVPGWGAIACYSPALDGVGNPVAGLAFVRAIAQALQLSVF